jgi:hypothetical protein
MGSLQYEQPTHDALLCQGYNVHYSSSWESIAFHYLPYVRARDNLPGDPGSPSKSKPGPKGRHR